MDTVIKNGTIGHAAGSYKADLGIENGKIVAIGEKLEGAAEIIDANGKVVVPAGVEIHTHIDSMLHGMRTVDDWYDASVGAAFGGTATIVDFPLQGQGQTLWETINEYMERAGDSSIADFAFTPIISKYNDTTYREIPQLIEQGMTTFKVFMYYDWKVDDYNLAKVLDTVASHGGIISIHCENAGTIDYLIDRHIDEGKTGIEWHAPTRPISTENEAVSRVLYLAEELDAPVLIVHMSSGEAVEMLAQARARGVKAYGEAMPHFLLLDESEYEDPERAWNVIMTPPLRPTENREQLWAAIRAGTLTTVGSDHCAFPKKDKKRLYETRGSKFTMIPHGVPGIETRLPLVYSDGVSQGRITLEKFVSITATNPARLAGIYPQKGTLDIGSDADITIIDPDKEVVIKADELHGNTDYTPFEGFELMGYPVLTMSRGAVLVRDGELVAERGCGEFMMKRNKFEAF